MKEISIIIPHYNSEDTLKELLQTIPKSNEIEIIIIDDNSKEQDNIIKNVKEMFPEVFFLKNESGIKGAGAARNIGLRKASGKWILFADSDDLYTPNAFSILKKYIDSEDDMIYFSPTSRIGGTTRKSDRHKIYQGIVRNYIKNDSLENELGLRFKFVVPWSKLIKRDVISDNNIFFEEIMHSNDILFSAKLGVHANKINAIDEVLYIVRENDKSLTSSMTEESFKIRFDAWVRFDTFIKKSIGLKKYKLLNFSGSFQLGRVFKNQLKWRNYIYVLKTCHSNQIPIFNSETFNAKYIYKYIRGK